MLLRLRHRPDFLKAAAARRHHAPAFTLQARARDDGSTGVRVGFTCSKKVGNAVARNRAKRRLREAARLTLPALARPGWDYVLIGRPVATAARPFAELCDDLAEAVARVHAAPSGPRRPKADAAQAAP
jgi:ribonuclease P protein component